VRVTSQCSCAKAGSLTLKLFYFAGMDTTAVLLTWTIVVLSMHPEWQDRTREEVRRVFGQNQRDLDGMNQLKLVSSLATRAYEFSFHPNASPIDIVIRYLYLQR
jgi:cytochrome P450